MLQVRVHLRHVLVHYHGVARAWRVGGAVGDVMHREACPVIIDGGLGIDDGATDLVLVTPEALLALVNGTPQQRLRAVAGIRRGRWLALQLLPTQLLHHLLLVLLAQEVVTEAGHC